MEEYHFRKKNTQYCDADTAIRKIKKGKRILVGSNCAEPQHLVHALARNAVLFRDNEVVHLLTMGAAPYVDPRYAGAFRHNAFFIGPNVREAISEGHADYTPIFLSEIPGLFKSGQMPIHCVMMQVSPPDENNMVSLGISVDILPAAIACADIVIAQVNRSMPHTCGASRVPLDCIDYVVAADEPLLELQQHPCNEVFFKIGENVARYIHDGDTLQLGIGCIPDAILANLRDKHDLGIHSEMVSDGIIDLCKKGNITNKKKGINEGISIVSFILGTRKLYDFVDRNPYIRFHPSEYVNDPFVIAQNKNMVSINSALQIDLTGQVCADSIGSKFYSGFGGQVDFIRGARRSPGGRSFIALPATAKDGAVSRIVPNLNAGAGVVTSRADVDYVATEYGVAYLHGKTVRERSLALMQIAHPKFRDELLHYLKQKHYVYLDQKTIKDDGHPVKDLIPYSHTFKDKKVYFRPLCSIDEKAIQDFFYSHAPETIYSRYLEFVDALPHEEAQARVCVDYNKDMAIAGFDSPAPWGQMVCIGRYTRKENNTAEIAAVVREDYQGVGIGTFLVEIFIKAARQHGLKRLTGYIGWSNLKMLHIAERLGFQVRESVGIDGYQVSMDLEDQSSQETAMQPSR